MENNTLERIRNFETYLDNHLNSLDIMKYKKFESIKLAGNVYEMARYMMKPIWYGATEILISQLLLNEGGKKKGVSVKSVISALEFSQLYYYLRDYFYYVYNVDNSVKWNFTGNKIKIDLLDDSFQVQQFLEMNNYFLKSKDVFSSFKSESEKIKNLIGKIEDEYAYSEEIDQAFKLCIKEAELKLANYHFFLTDDIKFENYSVKQFKEVYNLILARALLRRYFVSKHHKTLGKHDHSYILILDRKQFIDALITDSGYNDDDVVDIISDITLDKFKISKHQGINTFPLIYNNIEDNYIMFPNCFCFCDVFISLRKLWALKNSDRYGKLIAPIVGNELAKNVENLLITNGFPYVIRNYSIGKNLPDIDILAIWPEKEFGKVIFICETKNPIPEIFGKDFVRSIGSKGFLPKAKKQLDTIQKSLDPIKLRKFLIDRYPDGEFEYGIYALNFLIITSNNIGVFYSEGDYKIIDWETFNKIVKSSKGDILHILRSLNKELLFESCKKCSDVTWIQSKIGEYEVEIPVISLKSFLEIKNVIEQQAC